MNLIWRLCFFAFVVTIAGRAYTEDLEGLLLSESNSCGYFVTSRANESLQLEARRTVPPLEVVEFRKAQDECQIQDAYVEYALVFFLALRPSTLKYRFKLETRSEPAKFQVNVLLTWKHMTTDPPQAMCDNDGRAFFNKHKLGFVQYAHMHQVWEVNTSASSQEFHDEIKLDFSKGGWEQCVFIPIICKVRPLVHSNVVYQPAEKTLFKGAIHLEAHYAWGSLHPSMFFELVLHLIISIPLCILLFWFARKRAAFRESIMPVQRWFLPLLCLNLSSYGMFIIYLMLANSYGLDAFGWSIPAFTTICVVAKGLTAFAFFVLVLVTAKGWGVVYLKIAKSDCHRILALSIVYVSFMILIRVDREIMLLQPILDLFLWLWILGSLEITRNNLARGSRPEQQGKLNMYKRLHVLVLKSLYIYLCLLLGLAIAIMIIGTAGFDALYLIPPTLAMDLSFLHLLVGFGVLWAPSPITAHFSYLVSRESQQDQDDLTIIL